MKLVIFGLTLNSSRSDGHATLWRGPCRGYHVRDIEFTAAFDIDRNKVGKDLDKAGYAEPNSTYKFAEVPRPGIKVHRGMTHDGLGKYLSLKIDKAPGSTDDIVKILKQTTTDVVISYLPVGSEITDQKWCYIHMHGTTFGNVPLKCEVKLEVWDSPNSAGVVIDAVRCCKLALDRGIGGELRGPSSYFMKSPPEHCTDHEASERTEAFIRGNDQKNVPSPSVPLAEDVPTSSLTSSETVVR